MNRTAFKVAVAVLLTTMLVLLYVIGKQHSEARQPFERDQLAAEMKNTVTRITDRAGLACGHLPFKSKCEELRASGDGLIARIEKTKRDGSDEDLRSLSRFVAQLEINTAANLQTMEASAEFVKDLPRRLLEACDRYPVGDPNRPAKWICDAPR